LKLLVVDARYFAFGLQIDLRDRNAALAFHEVDLCRGSDLFGRVTGNYDNNGTVDAAYFAVWRDAMMIGSVSLPNDPTPGVVD